MKKVLSLLLIAALLLGMTACGGGTEETALVGEAAETADGGSVTEPAASEVAQVYPEMSAKWFLQKFNGHMKEMGIPAVLTEIYQSPEGTDWVCTLSNPETQAQHRSDHFQLNIQLDGPDGTIRSIFVKCADEADPEVREWMPAMTSVASALCDNTAEREAFQAFYERSAAESGNAFGNFSYYEGYPEQPQHTVVFDPGKHTLYFIEKIAAPMTVEAFLTELNQHLAQQQIPAELIPCRSEGGSEYLSFLLRNTDTGETYGFKEGLVVEIWYETRFYSLGQVEFTLRKDAKEPLHQWIPAITAAAGAVCHENLTEEAVLGFLEENIPLTRTSPDEIYVYTQEQVPVSISVRRDSILGNLTCSVQKTEVYNQARHNLDYAVPLVGAEEFVIRFNNRLAQMGLPLTVQKHQYEGNADSFHLSFRDTRTDRDISERNGYSCSVTYRIQDRVVASVWLDVAAGAGQELKEWFPLVAAAAGTLCDASLTEADVQGFLEQQPNSFLNSTYEFMTLGSQISHGVGRDAHQTYYTIRYDLSLYAPEEPEFTGNPYQEWGMIEPPTVVDGKFRFWLSVPIILTNDYLMAQQMFLEIGSDIQMDRLDSHPWGKNRARYSISGADQLEPEHFYVHTYQDDTRDILLLLRYNDSDPSLYEKPKELRHIPMALSLACDDGMTYEEAFPLFDHSMTPAGTLSDGRSVIVHCPREVAHILAWDAETGSNEYVMMTKAEFENLFDGNVNQIFG